jgi:2-aminoadipate transaminase
VLVTLDAKLDKPLYAQIRDQIRERILAGDLKTGERLEASRELAKRLDVHRTTVSTAYAELEAEGLIHGTVGRGTFVAPHDETRRASPPARRAPAGDFFWSGFFSEEPHDDSLGRLMASASVPGVISFAATHSAEDLAAVDLVRRALDAVLRREGARLLQYGSSDGYPPLRELLSARLRREGMAVEADELLITNGCQQSLDLLRRSLVAPGDAVACENPTYTGLSQVFNAPGIRLIGVPVGAEGINLDFLAAVLQQNKVKLLLVSPNFQNPTGVTMPLEARRRLLELAGEFQVPVAEDDIYGALRYRGRALPTLKALDTAGLVIYLNSFSKVGFPGLRVGWMVAARRVIERLRWAKQSADLHTNLLGQAVLEELGRRGWLDRLIRRACRDYERKLGVLRRAVERHFPPEAACVFPQGGMSVWVELPESLDASELFSKARDRGVIFAPARYFYFQHPRQNAFRLCFSAVPDSKIEEGVKILGEVMKEEIRRLSRGKSAARADAGVALV